MTNTAIINQALKKVNNNLKNDFDSQVISSFIENATFSSHTGEMDSDKSYFSVALVRQKERGLYNNNQKVSLSQKKIISEQIKQLQEQLNFHQSQIL